MSRHTRWTATLFLAFVTIATTLPAANAQSRWSWRPDRQARTWSSGTQVVIPYTPHVYAPYAPYYTYYYPYVPGGVQWHSAPTYYYWVGPGYYYTWRNPGTSVYYGPGYFYQYAW